MSLRSAGMVTTARERQTALCALSPGVRSRRPSLKCRQIPSFVADNTTPRAQEEAGQNDPFNPSLRRRSSELVSLTHTTLGGQ